MSNLVFRLPRYYQDSPQVSELERVLGEQAGALRVSESDTLAQLWVDTAPWGLDLWEQALGLPAGRPMEAKRRRARVLAKVKGTGSTTVERLMGIAAAFSTSAVEIVERFDQYRFEIWYTETIGPIQSPEDLAAIGTVADVMSLTGENRTIVRLGLEALRRTGRPGLRALLHEAGLDERPLTDTAIGYTLAPRINASGRMGCASLAGELLLTDDPARGEELSRALCDLNRERQAIEAEIYTECQAMAEALPQPQRHALVLAGEQWHQWVVGIVASRLAEKYSCPAFMICLQDGKGKGSCRSFAGFNLFAALERCAPLLEGFGGHELAAGFTISEENIDAFRARMNRYVRSASGGERAVSCLDVDAPISCPGEVTLAEVEQLDQLEPYGAGNPRPVFALLGATVDVLQPVGQGKHLKLRLSKGTCRFDAIFFSMTEETCGVAAGMRVDAAFYLQANTFRGNTTLQLQLIDIRPSLTPSRHEAADLDLLHRLVAGEGLTGQERARLQASRSQFAAFWTVLERQLRRGKAEEEMLPFLRRLSALSGGCESFLRAGLALAVFQERGLIALSVQGDQVTLSLNPIQGKVDLFACPYLSRLREDAAGKSGGVVS